MLKSCVCFDFFKRRLGSRVGWWVLVSWPWCWTADFWPGSVDLFELGIIKPAGFATGSFSGRGDIIEPIDVRKILLVPGELADSWKNRFGAAKQTYVGRGGLGTLSLFILDNLELVPVELVAFVGCRWAGQSRLGTVALADFGWVEFGTTDLADFGRGKLELILNVVGFLVPLRWVLDRQAWQSWAVW